VRKKHAKAAQNSTLDHSKYSRNAKLIKEIPIEKIAKMHTIPAAGAIILPNGLQHFRFCCLQKPGSQVAFSLRKSYLAHCCNVDM
jgi:hypothetical protein